ncbi:hypothetical protein [Novacetimonas pomaceti]|nr:hypothetical protein [Novacetimonas pomaceti]
MAGLSLWLGMAVCWPYLSALALAVPSRGGERTRAAVLSVAELAWAIGWWLSRGMEARDGMLLCPPVLLCLVVMVPRARPRTWGWHERIDAIVAQCVAGNAMAAMAADDVDVTIALLGLGMLARAVPLSLRHGRGRGGWRIFHGGITGLVMAQAGALVLSPLGNGPLDGLGMVLLVAGLLGACGLFGASLPTGRDDAMGIVSVAPVLYLLSGPVVSLDAHRAAMTLQAMMIGVGCLMVWSAALSLRLGQGQEEGQAAPLSQGRVMLAWIGLAVAGVGAGGPVGIRASVLALMAVCLSAPLRPRSLPWPVLFRHIRAGLPPGMPFVAMMMTLVAVARISVWGVIVLLPALWLLLVAALARDDDAPVRSARPTRPAGGTTDGAMAPDVMARNAAGLALLVLLTGGVLVVAWHGGGQ